MPLNLSTADGDFTPYIKYNAKAGRFYVRPQGAPEDIEINNPRLIFDFANIRTGWLYYAEGTGPEKIWDPSPSQAAARPTGPKKFKRGFEVMVFGGDNIPGIGKLGLREFSSTAANVIASILKMYAIYETGAKTNPGKVPFFKCVKVIPIQGAYGTNYEPDFALVNWVDRAKVPALDDHLERVAVKSEGATPFDQDVYTGGTANGHATFSGAPQPPRHTDEDLNDSIPF